MIRKYLYTNIESVTLSEYEADLLPQLPEWRKQQSERYRFLSDKVQSAMSFIILQNALKSDYGITDEILFERQENGKPYLEKHPDIHFNISHCRKGILCVISTEGSIGCDIEEIVEEIDKNIMDYCCNEAERQTIMTSKDPETEFTKLWTRKESLLKYTGDGLQNDISDILNTPLAHSLHIETYVEADKRIVYSVCH